MSLCLQDYVELESLAAQMKALGDSVLRAFQSAHGRWDGTIHVQLQQRDACYVQFANLWSERNLFWAHESEQSDHTVEDASLRAYELLEAVLSQNDQLQQVIHQSFAGTNERLMQINQQTRMEGAYRPAAKMAGGLIAELR